MYAPVAVLGLGRGGGTGLPVSLPPITFFANITQICDFFAFLNFRKVDKFAASIERPKTKSASATGRLCPLTP